jgi:hypothetical protein
MESVLSQATATMLAMMIGSGFVCGQAQINVWDV